MFLREVRIKAKGKEYRYWKALESYWDRKTKKNRHKTIMNLRCLTGEQVKQIKDLLAMKTLGPDSFITTLKEIEVGESYEFLNISILKRSLWSIQSAAKKCEKLQTSLAARVKCVHLRNKALPNPSSSVLKKVSFIVCEKKTLKSSSL